MRVLNLRHGLPPSERCDPVSTKDAMIDALDAALRFAASRELLSSRHVRGVFAMLDVASPLASDPGPVRDALRGAESSFAVRGVVSGVELADRLLDVRLVASARRPEPWVGTLQAPNIPSVPGA